MNQYYTVILKPLNRSVFQRDMTNNALVPIEVLYTRPVCKIRVKAESKEYSSDWTELACADCSGTGSLYLPAGGWYSLNFEAYDNNGNLIEENLVEKVGSGEVFVTCGQSNSINFGVEPTFCTDDRVSSWNPITRCWDFANDPQPCEEGPPIDMCSGGGSPWPTLGSLLAKEINMPVGFIATGWGGAAVGEFKKVTAKYKRLLNGLTLVGEYGARAVLWHQGETDSVLKTSEEDYRDTLLSLVSSIRNDIGWNVSWVIANAAFHPHSSTSDQEVILKAQKQCINGKDIFLGPCTDELCGDYRIEHSAHFTKKGLVTHGSMWAKSLIEYFYK